MRKLELLVAMAISFSGVAAGTAFALPVTSCVNNSGAGFTCDIYESLANGTPSEISNLYTLPANVSTGYIVVFENASGTLADLSTWSDVLKFGDGTGALGNTLQLFSGDAVTSALATIVRSSPTGTAIENADSFALYLADPNTYRIHSDNEMGGQVPEPSSLALAGTGLFGVGLLVKLGR